MESVQTKSITPGAGVDPNRVCKPGKRLRNWHRRARTSESLRQYARVLATTSGGNRDTARRWLSGKGVRP